jgi:DNA-binding GntR family transcriptional regulator
MASGEVELLLVDTVYARLRDMIVTNALQAGQKLVERDIALLLGVSRTPVRGALGLLAMSGMVENRARRGYYVSTFSAAQVSDLYEFRKILETNAARLAAQRVDLSQMGEIDRILEELDRLTPELENHSKAVQLDMRIHELIARASGSKLLSQAINSVLEKVMCFISVEIGERESLLAAHCQHRELLHAIRLRDSDRSAELMRLHIEDAQNSLLKTLSARENLRNAVLMTGLSAATDVKERDKKIQQGAMT